MAYVEIFPASHLALIARVILLAATLAIWPDYLPIEESWVSIPRSESE
jgi:hypothetical protein